MKPEQLMEEIEAAVWTHHVFAGNTREDSVAYAERLIRELQAGLPVPEGATLDPKMSAEFLVDHIHEWGKP